MKLAAITLRPDYMAVKQLPHMDAGEGLVVARITALPKCCSGCDRVGDHVLLDSALFGCYSWKLDDCHIIYIEDVIATVEFSETVRLGSLWAEKQGAVK
jgi:hypothetical protein